MGFLDFFKVEKENSEVNYLKHLMKVAISDGKLDENEAKFISKIGEKLNVPESQIEEIKKDVREIKFKEPQDFKSRFQLLFDLVWMMMLDDEMTKNEIEICTKMAKKLEYEPEIVDDLVKAIHENLQANPNKDAVYDNILASIQ